MALLSQNSVAFSSGKGERAKRERVWKSAPRERRDAVGERKMTTSLVSRGVIFTRARVSLVLLSLRKNGDYSQSMVLHTLRLYSPPRVPGSFSCRQEKLSNNVHQSDMWLSVLRDRRGAASLRKRNRAEITVLMCELKPYLVWFSWKLSSIVWTPDSLTDRKNKRSSLWKPKQSTVR